MVGGVIFIMEVIVYTCNDVEGADHTNKKTEHVY